jgi:KRAB domain-containing zinc finger protein
LKRHIQSLHFGEKSFTCDQCDKSFATKDKLNRHKKIHGKEKVYECARCHKKFGRKVCRDLY